MSKQNKTRTITVKVDDNKGLNIDSARISFNAFTYDDLNRMYSIFIKYQVVESINIGKYLKVEWLYENGLTNARIEHDNLTLFKNGELMYICHNKDTGEAIETSMFSLNDLDSLLSCDNEIQFKDLDKKSLDEILEISKTSKIDEDLFNKTFPLIKQNGCIKIFDDLDYLKDFLNINGIDNKEHYKYVFTCINGEGIKCSLLNGFHGFNRLYYVVSKVSWGTGNFVNDAYISIETDC